MPLTQALSLDDNNKELPYFSSSTWNLKNTDFLNGAEPILLNNNLPVFNWIQAFFDSTLAVIPYLAIWSGAINPATGLPIVNKVRFAYSGERVNIKGVAILTSGTDVRGDTVTSTPIGATLTTDLLEVIAQGGST